MARKQNARRKRIQKRIMRRQVSKIIEFIMIIGILGLEVILSNWQGSPDWYQSPLYYVLLFVVVIIVFAFIFFWAETRGKTDIDELEERIDQRFDNIEKTIKRENDNIKKRLK